MPEEKNSIREISPEDLTFDFFIPFLRDLPVNGHKGIVIRGRGYESDVRKFLEDIKPSLYGMGIVPNVLVHPFPNRREYTSARGVIGHYPQQLQTYELEHPKARFFIYDPIRKFGDLSERYLEFYLCPELGDEGGDLAEHFRAHHF